MDKIYDCLEYAKLYEIFKALGSARNAIFIAYGKEVICSAQYQELIHVLHDVQSRMAEIHVNECKKLENYFDIKKSFFRDFDEKDN